MEKNPDIRWKQRFSNFEKAVNQLQRFIAKGKLNEFEEQGLIQCFEYTYELGCNVLKDYLEYAGHQEINGSRTAIMTAFRFGLIEDGEGWMEMFKDRNKSSHTYNEDTANEIITHIYDYSLPLFLQLKIKLESFL
jgi:nucleotidyltransferase substrate binding protein (TIGR01987 family)